MRNSPVFISRLFIVAKNLDICINISYLYPKIRNDQIHDMSHEYEHRLMQRLSEGDEKAFRELFDSYYPKVRAFVECIVKESDTADDIAQDIFAKIWERREIFWGGGDFDIRRLHI